MTDLAFGNLKSVCFAEQNKKRKRNKISNQQKTPKYSCYPYMYRHLNLFNALSIWKQKLKRELENIYCQVKKNIYCQVKNSIWPLLSLTRKFAFQVWYFIVTINIYYSDDGCINIPDQLKMTSERYFFQ